MNKLIGYLFLIILNYYVVKLTQIQIYIFTFPPLVISAYDFSVVIYWSLVSSNCIISPSLKAGRPFLKQ